MSCLASPGKELVGRDFNQALSKPLLALSFPNSPAERFLSSAPQEFCQPKRKFQVSIEPFAPLPEDHLRCTQLWTSGSEEHEITYVTATCLVQVQLKAKLCDFLRGFLKF